MNGTYVPVGMQKFQVTFATKTVPPAGIIPPVDIEGNLMKFGIQNTPGVAFPLRDQQDFKVITPLETIKKGVKQVNSGTVNNPPIDGVTVKGSDLVTYQIDVKSTLDTKDVEVWDQLPAAYDCTMVSAITDFGVCSTSSGISRIKWTIPAINDGVTKSLTYKVLIPGTFGPENTYTNNSGVRSYQADTNLGERYTYVPANNIDPNAPTANVARVDDPSNVKTPDVGMLKTRTTSIDETGNDINTQATIGETINYTVDAFSDLAGLTPDDGEVALDEFEQELGRADLDHVAVGQNAFLNGRGVDHRGGLLAQGVGGVLLALLVEAALVHRHAVVMQLDVRTGSLPDLVHVEAVQHEDLLAGVRSGEDENPSNLHCMRPRLPGFSVGYAPRPSRNATLVGRPRVAPRMRRLPPWEV